MKSSYSLSFAALVCVVVATDSHAQMGMGMDFFKRPAIAGLFKPVVGAGAAYESTSNEPGGGSAKEPVEYTVVGKDTAGGKEAVWIEFAHSMKGVAGVVYSKMLVTRDDFHIVKNIIQIPGHPAMEMRMSQSARAQQNMRDEMNKWTQIGTETITVPAGTFSCQHWKKNGSADEIWASEKVAPFGMVKEVIGNSTQVLVRVITDAKDHMTGPVSPFDPALFRQMIMDQVGKEPQ